jgi:hypothetical protein
LAQRAALKAFIKKIALGKRHLSHIPKLLKRRWIAFAQCSRANRQSPGDALTPGFPSQNIILGYAFAYTKIYASLTKKSQRSQSLIYPP